MADPRSRSQRIVDTLRRLREDTDAWVASTNAERPWLVPLSFLWHDGQLLFATNFSTPTAGNAQALPRVRVALSDTRDVVLVEGQVTLAASTDLTDDEIATYQAKHGSDPRTWADSVLRVKPSRILAWREENELAGRLLMRGGDWLH